MVTATSEEGLVRLLTSNWRIYNQIRMQKNSQFILDLGQGLSLLIGDVTIPTWNKEERPKKAKVGTFGFNLSTNSLEFWDGTNWWAAEMK